jgi:hypothetical protein
MQRSAPSNDDASQLTILAELDVSQSEAVDNFLKTDDFQNLIDLSVAVCVQEELLLSLAVTQLSRNAKKRKAKARRNRGPNRQRGVIEGGMKIFNDYFSENPVYSEQQFRRRFRMSSSLCKKLIREISADNPYFAQKQDRAGRWGAYPHQKITAALRFLCYGTAYDAQDEYCRLSEATVRESVFAFARDVCARYGPTYLREPRREDVAFYLERNARRGFPGMFASIDCVHFEWDMCSTAARGQHLNKDKEVTNILEAMATDDCWIWHAFFGMPGSCNDLNVLNNSSFMTILAGGGLHGFEYTVNGSTRHRPYVLTDGIYPSWACFMKAMSNPMDEMEQLFAWKVAAVRKDIERSFGILRKRFSFLKQPCRLWYVEDIGTLVKCCLCLHNMIVEDERDDIMVADRLYFMDELERERQETINVDEDEEAKAAGPWGSFFNKLRDARDPGEHFRLRNDLVQHVWDFQSR